MNNVKARLPRRVFAGILAAAVLLAAATLFAAPAAAETGQVTYEGFALANMAPGDSSVKTVELKAGEELLKSLRLTCDDGFFDGAPHSGDVLILTVSLPLGGEERAVYDGPFDGLAGDGVLCDLGYEKAGGDPVPITLTVSLPLDAGNEVQGERASGTVYVTLATDTPVTIEDEMPPRTSDNGLVAAGVMLAGAMGLFALIGECNKQKRSDES